MKNNDNKITRKGFLKTVTAAATVAVLGSIFKPSLRAFAKGSGSGKPAESGQWKSTTCQGCTSWCSIQVYVVDGRAIKVRGNPNSKVNLGNCCARCHLSLQQVYDPDRVKVPMKRTNPKKGRNEDPKFVPISWDEALGTIADKIMDLRKNEETHKYMLMRGRYSYMRDVLYDRMTKIIGSPNNISHSAICAEAEKFGPYYTEGVWGYRQYDVLNTRYILLWGADPLSANRQVSYYLSAWGDVLDRADVAVVDPRFSASAAMNRDNIIGAHSDTCSASDALFRGVHSNIAVSFMYCLCWTTLDTWSIFAVIAKCRNILKSDIRIFAHCFTFLAGPCDTSLYIVLAFTGKDASATSSATLEIYTQLFVGPFKLLAPPYGSFYLEDGTMMGESTVDARNWYEREGLDIVVKDVPDHIAMELEFMHYLAVKQGQAIEKGDIQGAEQYQHKQKSFLGVHLSRWLPKFAENVQENAQTNFYRKLASLTDIFVQRDLDEGLSFE